MTLLAGGMILVGALMLWTGIRGYSLGHALTGTVQSVG